MVLSSGRWTLGRPNPVILNEVSAAISGAPAAKDPTAVRGIAKVSRDFSHAPKSFLELPSKGKAPPALSGSFAIAQNENRDKLEVIHRAIP